MKKTALLLKTAICLLLLGLIGCFWYIKSQDFTHRAANLAMEEAANLLKANVQLDTVEVKAVNELLVNGIVIYDGQGGKLLEAKQATVHFRPTALFDSQPLKAIDEVVVQSPQVKLIQRQDGSWNYQDVITGEKKQESDFAGTIRIEDGNVNTQTAAGILEIAAIKGTADFSRFPAVRIKGTCTQREASVEISGSLGGKNQTLDLTGTNFELEDYLPFIPAEKLQGVSIKKGHVEKAVVSFSRDGSESAAINGEVQLDKAEIGYRDKKAEDIKALLVFNEKQLQLFAQGLVEAQPLSVHGRVHLDTEAPWMELVAESKDFRPEKLFPQSPFSGAVAFTANISGTFAEPVIQGVFKVKDGLVYGYPLQGAEVKASFKDNVLVVDEMSASAFGGEIHLEGSLDARDIKYRAHIKTKNINAEELPFVVKGLSGKLTADIAISGQGEDFSAAEIYGSASLRAAYYQGIGIEQAETSFYKNGDLVTIDALSMVAAGGRLSFEGSVQGRSLNLEFRGLDLDLQQLAQAYPGIAADISGQGEISGRIYGTIENPAVDADFSAENGVFFKQPYAYLSARAKGSLNGVDVYDFRLENKGRTIHTGHGVIGFTGERKIDFWVETKGARMEDLGALLLPGQPITGNVDNVLQLTGSLDDLQLQGRVHFYEGSYHGIFLTGADGVYRRHDGRLQIDDFSVASPFVTMHLRGVMDNDENLDFSVNADDIHLDKVNTRLPYPVSGTAGFTGTLRGNLNAPVFLGQLEAKELVLNGQKIVDAGGRIEYRNDILYLNDFSFRQNGGAFAMTALLSDSGAQGTITAKLADVNALLAIANYKNDILSGHLDGKISFGGTFNSPIASMEGFIAKGALKGYPLSNINVDISLEDHVLRLNRFYGEQGLGKVAAQGSLERDGGPLTGRVSAQDIDAGLFSALTNMGADLKGTLNLDAQLGGTLENPSADVSIDVINGGVGTATFDSLSVLTNLKNGIISVDQALMKKGEYKASAYGVVPLKALQSKPWEMPDNYEQIQLQIGLDHADLSILPLLSDQVDWGMGPLSGRVLITGTLAHPLFNGGIRSSGGAIKLKAFKNPLQNIEVDIAFKNDQMLVNTFSGLMGGGSYNLTGSTLITGGGFAEYNFQLNADKLGVDCDFYQGPLTGQLTLGSGEFYGHKLPRLAGNIDIKDATLSIPAIPDTKTTLPNLIVDVGVNVGEKVRLYSSMLYDLSLRGSAHFGGTTHYPQSSGTIEVTRGKINYLKTVFDVRDGAAYFTQVNSFLPMIHLSADTKIDRTRIYFNLDGPADKMTTKLSSDSNMSDSEILQLLTLRSNYRSGESSTDSASGLSNMLDIGLRMSFLSAVDSIVRNAIQVDEFNIVRDTAQISTEGSTTSTNKEVYNVEIGKYISDKYMLKYTRGIGYNKDKVTIQYDVNDRIGLTSAVDSNSGYTIGIEARFKF